MLELTGGIGVDAALECVGTAQSMDTALPIARPGSTVGVVGVPPRRGAVPRHLLPQHRLARRSGPRPPLHPRAARRRPRRAIDPGLVLDFETDLDGIAEAYEAMDERRAIKSLVRIGSV